MEAPPIVDSVIRQMPDVLANKIAAGEVVQRPESVVKELVENAIDAGAGRVTIRLKKAGIERIQVTDDGCGMSELDVRQCMARHATSKITSIDDLESVETLGFRGEALASIGAVARVRLRTQTSRAVAGTEIRHDGGVSQWIGPCATTVGTSVTVSDLFYNVPARRKFLKSQGVELRRVVDLVQQIALSHPDIAFELEHDGRQLLSFEPDVADTDGEAIAKRTTRVFGVAREQLVLASESTSYLNVTGVVGRPSLHRRSRGQQVFIVNGRVVKNRYLEHAVRGAYGDAISDGDFPLFVLFLELDAGHVDVNVHPSKAEVKFDDERGVYAFVRAIVGKALAQADSVPQLDPKGESGSTAASLSWTARGTDGLAPEPRSNWGANPQHNAGELSRFLLGSPEGQVPEGTSAEILEREEDEQHVWPVAGRYLVLRLRSGLLVVDQSAAHERVIYERVVSALATGGGFCQQLLFPQTIDLTASQLAVVNETIDDLRRVGFDLDPFGGSTIVVRGVPADMSSGDVATLFVDVVDRYNEGGSTGQIERHDRLARSVARCSAIRSNTKLAQPEMRSLIDQLLLCEHPRTAPDGRPTMVTLGENELARWFTA